MQEKKNEPPKDNNFKWKKATRTLFFWLLIFIGAIYVVQIFNLRKPKEIEIWYPEYRKLLEDEAIEKATIRENEFHGKLKYENTIMRNGTEIKVLNFRTVFRLVDREMIEEWEKYGFEFKFENKGTEWWGYVISMLPWLLLLFLYIFFLRRLQGGGGSKGIFSFGKSRAKLLTENLSKVTFEDVAGADEAKQELREIIDFLKAPEKFRMLGGRIPKGVLLLGPPGTGKTLLAKAVAGEAGVPFMSISGADFVEMFVGVGASRVRDLFEQGKKNAPCIIFIDEIDAVGRHRGAGLGGGHDEREQTLNQLLVEMDGFETNEGVILLAATNRPDVLDQALLRPGRFDRQVVVDRPDVRGREGILNVHTRKIPLAKDIDLEVIAKGTPGFSGADLANLVNEAALLAARRDKKQVEMEDFEDAKDKVMMGVERKSLIISDREKRNTAYHESGHVLVSKLLPEADPVHKVTIIPRGRALGVTSYLPIDERHTYSKKYLETVLTYMLGGRAAELIVMKELSNGAGNDIDKATELARKMVCEWGMSEKIGPVTFGKKSEEIFLGREIAQHRDYSESTAILIDHEVKRIVQTASDRAVELLKDHEPTLHRIAEALLDKEILSGDEIDDLIKGSGRVKVNSRGPARKRPVPKKKTAPSRRGPAASGEKKKTSK